MPRIQESMLSHLLQTIDKTNIDKTLAKSWTNIGLDITHPCRITQKYIKRAPPVSNADKYVKIRRISKNLEEV